MSQSNVFSFHSVLALKHELPATTWKGQLNNEDIKDHFSAIPPLPPEPRGGSKKACPELVAGFVQPCPESGRRKGRSHFYARSVWRIREHRKMARTPLTTFFNSPLNTLKHVGRDWRSFGKGVKIRWGRQLPWRELFLGRRPATVCPTGLLVAYSRLTIQ